MFWIIVISQAIAFGVLSAIVASNKDRSGGAWFFIGFLFGIFGFAASLVVKKKADQPSAPTREALDPSRATKQCPDCAETIKLQARVCRYCGYRFDEETVDAQVQEYRQQFHEQTTPSDLKSVNDGIHCAFCGKPTEENFGAAQIRSCAECINTPKARQAINIGVREAKARKLL